jgi:6-phosphofructokinase 1
MPRLAVLTSGGDAPGMNTAVATVVKVGTARGAEVLGVDSGYEGLIEGRLRPLLPVDVDGWWHRGGTELGSARSADFRTPEGRARAAAHLGDVDGLIVIGGNGSLTGARLLAEEHGIPVVGVPASIDNDIACTDTAIGVDTALNTIVEACDRISDTASSHRRVFIVEVMGRECGYLAMAGAIATAADAAIFREQGKSEDQLVEELRGVLRASFAPERHKRRVLILKAEGVDVPTARLCARLESHVDEDAPGVHVRHVVLGHTVRGGPPSFRDRLVAGRLAFAAVNAALDGPHGGMVGWSDGETPTADPKVGITPLGKVLDETRTLLDGSHPTTRRRLRMLEAVQGVLPL